MTNDEMELEARIAEILDRLGLEMQQAATRLRFSPFCSVEAFLTSALDLLQGIDSVKELLKDGSVETALRYIGLLKVPEIDFVDEEQQ
jgi:hypothetical protein